MAMDVGSGPLERAREHIRRARLEDQIQIVCRTGCGVKAGRGGIAVWRAWAADWSCAYLERRASHL